MAQWAGYDNGFPAIAHQFADTILVNHKGRYDCESHTVSLPGVCLNYTAGECGELERVTGTAGQTIRLRLVHSGGHALISARIVDHTMRIVQVEGTTLVPTDELDVVYLTPGQRYDVLVTLDQPVGNYWISFASVDEPPRGKDALPAMGMAILSYTGADSTVEPDTSTMPDHGMPSKYVSVEQELSFRRNTTIHPTNPPPASAVTKRVRLDSYIGYVHQAIDGTVSIGTDMNGAPSGSDFFHGNESAFYYGLDDQLASYPEGMRIAYWLE